MPLWYGKIRDEFPLLFAAKGKKRMKREKDANAETLTFLIPKISNSHNKSPMICPFYRKIKVDVQETKCQSLHEPSPHPDQQLCPCVLYLAFSLLHIFRSNVFQ